MAEYIVTVEEDSKNFEEMFIGAIRSYPKLIRCKDCKHWDGDDGDTFCSELGIFGTDPNSFCSYAKRKEE